MYEPNNIRNRFKRDFVLVLIMIAIFLIYSFVHWIFTREFNFWSSY